MDIVKLIELLGGRENITAVTNCMTRLRITVAKEDGISEQAILNLEGVLELVHDVQSKYEIVVGPGKSKKYADELYEQRYPSSVIVEQTDESSDWKKNKEEIKSKQKHGKGKEFLKIFGDIFVPLIPGTIAAGLCSGIAMLLEQLCPGYKAIPVLNLLYQLLTMIKVSFMTYIAAWAGYRAAEYFGATPILGGMIGIITSLDNVNIVAEALGLYNSDTPLESVLCAGKGGVLAAIFGVYALSVIEKKIRKHMPDSLDIVFTPVLSMFICLIPYLFIFMPVLGYVSNGICWGFGKICMSSSVIVRAIAGFLGAALFLPMVTTGMHHGMVAFYTTQLQQFGFVTLYPALCMAGAGQVGASIAILIRAKKSGNQKLINVIKGALPAGFLGVGEPLTYGVTLPMGLPFITAGIGAGFGGALVMISQVASTTWGPSGILGVFVMTAGPNGAVGSILYYLIGLVVSYVASGLITYFAIKSQFDDSRLLKENLQTEMIENGIESENMRVEVTGRRVTHGEYIMLPEEDMRLVYTITDPNGIHARPASMLINIGKEYSCDYTIAANGKETEMTSVMSVMSLNIKCGTEIEIKAKGDNSEAALCAMKSFLESSM